MPLRIDIEAGSEHYLPFAKNKLAELRNLDIDRRLIYVSSGESIYVQRGEVDLIRVRGASESMAILGNCSNIPIWSNMTITRAMMNTAGVPTTVVVPAAPVSLVVKGTRITTTDVVDHATLKITMLKRAITMGELEFAERLVRQLPGMSSAETDGALFCNEGFFIDTSLYAAQPYYADLVKAAGAHDSTFVHTSVFSTFGLTANATTLFPEIDLTAYQPINGFTGNAPCQFSYGDPANHTILKNTNYLNIGTGLLQVYHISSAIDTVPVGTTVTCKRVTELSDSASVTYLGNHKYSDALLVKVLHYAETTYQITTESPLIGDLVMITGEVVGVTGSAPVTGYVRPRVKRVFQRRTPTGNEITMSDPASPVVEIQPFSADGSFTIAVPPADTYAASIHQDGAALTAYAQNKYLGSAVSFTTNATLTPTVFMTVNQEPRGSIFGSAVYGASITPEVLAPNADLAVKRFVGKDGTTHEITVFNQTVVKSKAGVVVTIDPFTAPSVNALFAGTSVHKEYTYPQAANLAASLAAATLTFGLQVFNPHRAAVAEYLPPFIGDTSCLYDVRSGKYVYFRFANAADLSSNLTQLATNVAVAIAVGADATVIAAAQAAYQARIIVLADGGLSHDLLFLGVNGVLQSIATILI